ncbi:MAG: FemAB family PEP-CTERM system-associated protein [Deferrisomatales bacterium]
MSAAPVTVEFLRSGDEGAWDAYVTSHSEGTPFHLVAWREAVEATFGHDPYYLVARRGGLMAGALPLFHVRSRLFGSMLVSVAFAVYGGALADDEEAAQALEAAAADLAERLGVAYLELRDRAPAPGREGVRKELYVTFRKELPAEPDEVLPAIPRKTRRMVRLGIKGNLRGTLTRSPRAVDELYGLFALNLRKLGTPAFPRSLLENLLVAFGEAADILIVRDGDRPLAAVLNLYFRDEVLPYYSGALPEAQRVGGNNFLYYDLMVKSLERGYRRFDFGRSKVDTGPYHFKRHFGFSPEPLPYRFQLVRAGELPELNPTNPKYAKAIELWKKLPLGLTTALGPRIVRGIP